MKKLLFIFLLLPVLSFAQKKSTGYGQIGGTLFLDESAQPGASVSGGAAMGDIVTIGAGFDLYLFKKDALHFVNAYGDFRFYFSGLAKKATPFLAFQPGWILYNETFSGIKISGNFAVNGLLGFTVKTSSSPGFIIMLGVSHISFKTTIPNSTNYVSSEVSGNTGFKITGAIRL